MKKHWLCLFAVFAVTVSVVFATGLVSVRSIHVWSKDAAGKTRIVSVR
jgi:hypothetical protein